MSTTTETPEVEDYEFGVFGINANTEKNKNQDSMKLDRIAVDDYGRLLFASVVGPANVIKAARALISMGAASKSLIEAGGVKVKRTGDADWRATSIGRLMLVDGGYHFESHKLQYDNVHAMFFARHPGFMRVMTDEALWQELRRPEFTTPILKSWLPYIKERAMDDGLLKGARCYRCDCGILVCDTADLDRYVSEGLKRGKISIPPWPPETVGR